MSKATMKADDNGVSALVQFKDKHGNAASVVGAPEWSLSSDGVVSMTVAGDGLSAEFAPVAVGTVTVNVKAEGDATPGTDTISLSGDIEVIAAEAATGEIDFGPVT